MRERMSVDNIRALTREYKYKIELHAHTKPVSPCSDMLPEMLIERYKNLGFDGVAITNHYIAHLLKSEDPQIVTDNYLRDYYETKNFGEKYNIKVYLGMEIRFPESDNDYLLYGIDESDVRNAFSYIHTDYATFYKAFKNEQNLIVQAHPFRGKTVQDASILDGIEVFNVHPGHNSRNAAANQYAKEHPHLLKTCGTDFHHEGHQGLGATRVKALPENSVELAQVLKSRDYLFDVMGSIIIP